MPPLRDAACLRPNLMASFEGQGRGARRCPGAPWRVPPSHARLAPESRIDPTESSVPHGWMPKPARVSRRRVALALGVMVAGFLGGACARTAAVHGNPIPPERVADIVAGKTTEAEIREWFGTPAEVVVTNTGKVLTYQYRAGSGAVLSLPFLGIGGGTARGQLLIVTLDRDGRVARHTFLGGP